MNVADVACKVENLLKEMLRQIQVFHNICSDAQYSASYPVLFVDVKNIVPCNTLPESYNVVFSIGIVDDKHSNKLQEYSKLICAAIDKNIQNEKYYLSDESLKIYNMHLSEVVGKLRILNCNCNGISQKDGQDLISKKVSIDYTCYVYWDVDLSEVIGQ